MTQTIRQDVWKALFADFGVMDKITVSNLEVIVNAGVDVWGRQKTQRAQITVTLSLSQPFDSAAASDALDTSTVHYGILSKDIRGLFHNSDAAWISTEELAESIKNRTLQTAGQAPILAVEVDISYPKGSMFGEAAGLTYSITNIGLPGVSKVLYLRNVQVPCLIGVNSNERLQKQPVVVNVWVDCLPPGRGDDYPTLESTIMNAISSSSFETLETLSTMVMRELQQDFFNRETDKGAYIRLRVEKPLAVPFADAPAIEITRPVRV